MDIDSSYIECFIQDWIEHFHELIKEQENLIKDNKEFCVPLVGIPEEVITAIFKITDHLEMGLEARYLTIHLYDKFMCNYFWEVYKEEMTKGPTEDSWKNTCKTIETYSKLYLVSCLQLASKMVCHSKSLGVSQVLDLLKWIDAKHEYVANSVFHSEYKVFKTVGFKMPTCIPFYCIEVLLAATNLRKIPNAYDISMNLLDLVYLQHDQLYSHIYDIAVSNSKKSEYDKKSLKAMKTNVLFLSAFVILCATFFLGLDDENIKVIAAKLEELVNIKDKFILDMANILLVIGIQEEC